MEEDDDVDILGDFSVENSSSYTETFDTSAALGSQSSELLTCDYSTPLYLDSSATQSLWFSNNGNSYFPSEIPNETQSEVQQEKVKESVCVGDDSSGWTVKEKGLLYNGVQIFGKNNVYLAKFIGSKTADEVKFFLRHFYIDKPKTMSSNSQDVNRENSTLIPSSIQEAINTVSTAKPTVNLNIQRNNKINNFNKITKKTPKKGFKNVVRSHQLFKNNKKLVQKTNLIKKSVPYEEELKTKSTNGKLIDMQETISETTSLQVGEVVKIQKPNPEDTESDVEVDIESVSEDENTKLIDESETKNSYNANEFNPKKSKKDSIQNNGGDTIESQNNSHHLGSKNKEYLSRQRFKKKFSNNGKGGKTLAHGKDGEVIHTTIVDESSVKKSTEPKKPQIRLICCRSFDEEFPQPFKVLIHISALLLMDLHAHTCYTEVMGLVGGTWDHQRALLTVRSYQPCRNTANSATHCDMCPIAQAKAADDIHAEGCKVVGWFHSHPTFAPEPSQQDIDTQKSLQVWVGGDDRPFVGFILSPYEGVSGSSAPSNLRCLIVDKKRNFEDQFVPYKFRTSVVAGGFEVGKFLRDSKRILEYGRNITETNNVFEKEYFLDKSVKHREKFLNSVKMHLIKCENINKMTCDAIADGLTKLTNYV